MDLRMAYGNQLLNDLRTSICRILKLEIKSQRASPFLSYPLKPKPAALLIASAIEK